MAKLEKSVRIAGQSRTELGADLKTQYEQGASVRELARATGRSYGFIHAVLTEAQVPLRGRGLPGTTDPPHSPVKCPVTSAPLPLPVQAQQQCGYLVPDRPAMVTCRRGGEESVFGE